jgi:hypothetical protein
VIGTASVTLALAVMAMAPGALLSRKSSASAGVLAAACTASLIGVMLLTALLGCIASLAGATLPSWSMAVVSLLGIAAVFWSESGPWFRRIVRLDVDWSATVFAGLLVAFGLISLAIGVREGEDGSLWVHSWYNADWFKHLGHVHALANFGVPAQDIFNNQRPLHYYWLSYLLPGAATSLSGDAWVAISTANAIVVVLFAYLFVGIIRLAVPDKITATTAALLATLLCAPMGFFFFFFLGGNTLQDFFATGNSPSGSALLVAAQVIPQHTLALCALLAWLVANAPRSGASPALRTATLVALAAVPAISTLLGATLLTSYGLLRLWRGRIGAIPELAAMAVASAAVVILLRVIQIGNFESAIESPLLTNPIDPRPGHVLAIAGLLKVISLVGLPMLLAAFAFLRWKPEDERSTYARDAAVALVIGSFAIVMLTQILLTERLAAETFIRAAIPLSIGAATPLAWAMSRAWSKGPLNRMAVVGILSVASALALPSLYARMAWFGNIGDSYTTHIPTDDRRVLRVLREESGPRDTVWQYPEKPLVGTPPGGDSWSAILAGRAVPNSERATDYPAALPYIRLSERWFGGEVVPIPAGMDWVYLSRALHPASYDRLAERMKRDPAWTLRRCYPDACVFSRRHSTRP